MSHTADSKEERRSEHMKPSHLQIFLGPIKIHSAEYSLMESNKQNKRKQSNYCNGVLLLEAIL